MCVSTISRKSCWKKFCTSTQGCHYVVWTPDGTKGFLVERDDSYTELLLNYLYKLIHFVHVCVVSGLSSRSLLTLFTIQNDMDSKSYTCGIFIDLKKAFDAVNHEILLQNCIIME